MNPRPFKQVIKFNELLQPKEHREKIQNANFELWNELTAINSYFPNEEIIITHVVRDFGTTYGIDMELFCKNKDVQSILDEAYERSMRIPRFVKHETFEAMKEQA